MDVLDGNDGAPERYQCQIAIQNNPSDFGFIVGPISISTIDDAGIPPSPIAASVKFNNYVVGKNLLSTNDSWHDSLKRREKDTLHRLKPWSASIRQALTLLGTISGLWFSYSVLAKLSFVNSIELWLTLFLSVSIIFWQVAYSAAKYFETFIDQRQNSANIFLTVGDDRAEEQREFRNRGYFRKAAAGVAVVLMELVFALTAAPIITAIWQ